MPEKIWLTNRGKEEPMFESVFLLSVGQPKATAHYTVEQLEAIDMVGVYRELLETTSKSLGKIGSSHD